MKTLIIPMAGKSTRFPGGKPKWMLTHPKTNGYMVMESMSGLNLDFFDQIIFVATKKQEEIFCFSDGLNKQLEEKDIHNKSRICLLSDETSSQSETVYRALIKENISGYFYVKDSDSHFKVKINGDENVVSYADLSDQGKINASSKSYIDMDQSNVINNIIEKKVIGSTFSVGGYGFNSAESFIETYESLESFDGECFISHIIYEMILSGEVFYGLETTGFEDYGTIDDWNEYKNRFGVFFVDLDGTLVENTGYYNKNSYGSGNPIQENIDALNKLKKNDSKVIITTSRPESERVLTVNELKEKGVMYDYLIMGLPHCRRYLINDFADSNPYPSAVAVNLKRNSDDLRRLLK